MPADGWYQLAPLGEFAHAQAGVVQVVDQAACEAMAERFSKEAQAPNFAGALIDFDHFSLDGEKRSEAAGWITALEARCPVGSSGAHEVGTRERVKEKLETGNWKLEGERSTLNAQRSTLNDGGLWAKIRWSDIGEEAVKGGRYRFLSPVWRRGDCEDLGNGRVRPMRLHNAAVTNDPNLKGLRPLSNRAGTGNSKLETGSSGERLTLNAQRLTPNEDGERPANGNVDFLPGGEGKIVNGGLNAGMLEWMLGEGDDHCPGCVALAGQVHSREAWEAAGVLPGGGKTYCGEHCRCRLEPTDKGETGELGGVPLRKEKKMEGEKTVANGKPETGNWKLETGNSKLGGEAANAQRATLNSQRSTVDSGGERLTFNTQRSTLKDGMANIGWTDVARAASLAVRRAKAAARRAREMLTGKSGNEARDAVKEQLDAYVEAAIDGFVEEYGRKPATDAEIAEAEEMSGMPEEYRTHGEPISEEELIDRIMERDSGEVGADGEPVDEEGVYTLPGAPAVGPGDNDNWGWFLDEGLAGMSADAIAEMADEVATRIAAGGELDAVQQEFTDALVQKAAGLVEKAWRGETLTPDERVILESLKGVVKLPTVPNRGWTDAARRASLAVRQAKAAARRAKEAGEGGQEAVSGEQGDAVTPVPPKGEGAEPEGYAEKRSRLAAEIDDWYRRAYDAFVEKNGREPLSDQDVIEAEKLADVPEMYRTGGEDVQALVVADKVLWDEREREREQQAAVGGKLANVGWTDESRRAALAVRRAKAQARGPTQEDRRRQPSRPPGINPPRVEFNPHWPVYRQPVIRPPGRVTMPPRRMPDPGKPIPDFWLFGR